MKRNVMHRRTVLRGLVGGAVAAVGLPDPRSHARTPRHRARRREPAPRPRSSPGASATASMLEPLGPGRHPHARHRARTIPLSAELAPLRGREASTSRSLGLPQQVRRKITHHEGMTIFSGHTMTDIGQGSGFFSNARGPTIDQVAAMRDRRVAPRSRRSSWASSRKISQADYGTTMHNLSHKGHLQPLPADQEPAAASTSRSSTSSAPRTTRASRSASASSTRCARTSRP